MEPSDALSDKNQERDDRVDFGDNYDDEDASAAADFDDDDDSKSLPLKPSDFTSGTFSWGREASHRESPLITFHTIQPSLNLFLSYPTLSHFTFHTSHFQVFILSHFTFHACFLTPFTTLLDVMPLHFSRAPYFSQIFVSDR